MSQGSEPGTKKKSRARLQTPHPLPEVSAEVPEDRRSDILRYLELFGYKPERTILQIHIAGFFNRRKSGQRRQAQAGRYGGTTFVVVGRVHDPAVMDVLIKPRKKADQASPGYVGYLWKSKDLDGLAPHELLPLDFTPAQLHYPQDWKSAFATKGFMVAMHVPANFAAKKNRLTRALYRIGKSADVKARWGFLSELEQYGYNHFLEEGADRTISKDARQFGETAAA